MHVSFDGTFNSWREKAREFLQNNISPEELVWAAGREFEEQPQILFDAVEEPTRALIPQKASHKSPLVISQQFLKIARYVSFHSNPHKWNLLYRLSWRLCYENKNLLFIAMDDDMREFYGMQRDIRIDVHKTHAFVRFKKIIRDGDDYYIAWHGPRHPTLRLSAPFFVNRFGSMRWSIYTAQESAHWDLENLRFGPGVPQELVMNSDNLEELWKTYYKSIFNPARIKLNTMKLHMPKHHWKTLPETEVIQELLSQSGARLDEMFEKQKQSARAYLPKEFSTREELSHAVSQCRGCPLFENATQPVFGVGPKNAEIVIVGEQPGDEEDKAGQPFLGPAGQILESALVALGIERKNLYVTNAVKHFKWQANPHVQGGRLHRRPTAGEIGACKPWLEAEMSLLDPKVVICLGATAAQSVLGRLVSVSEERGQFQSSGFCDKTLVTYHPSAILRATNEKDAEEKWELFLNDLAYALGIKIHENSEKPNSSPPH